MRYIKLKARLSHASMVGMQKYSLPNPPASVTRMVTHQNIQVKGAKGIWLNKHHQAQGVLVYLHGGGYITGPLKAQWEYIARLARGTKMAALVIDYKQLPEYAFPAGFNDVLTLIITLQATGDLPANWYLVGDSAGGGLAVAICYKLRDTQVPLPQKLILMSPWLDLTMSNPAYNLTVASDPMLPLGGIRQAAAAYTRDADPRNPYISPMFGEMKGLPPTLIQVGTAEILLWDNRKFYLKLLEAQVPVHYEEYPDLFHVFVVFHYLPEAKKALKSQVNFLLKPVSEENNLHLT